MKSIDATWHCYYELHLHCPYCEIYIDPYDIDGIDVPDLGDIDAKPFKGKVECEECGKTFYLNAGEYIE